MAQTSAPEAVSKSRGAPSEKLHSVQVLRGVAALAVTFHHLATNQRVLIPPHVKDVTFYGAYGVEAFFVLSGFILPWSMRKSGYRVEMFWQFLLKRVIRIDPPYLASIVLAIAAALAGSSYLGADSSISVWQVVAHLGYANAFLGWDWLNPVYWTLAIEAQFYVLIALCYPLLNSSWRWAVFAALIPIRFLLPSDRFLPYYASVFLLGMGLYLLKSRVTSELIAGCWIAACVAAIWLELGVPQFAGAIVGAILILSPIPRIAALDALGAISYSLYLTHNHTGVKLEALLAKHMPWWAAMAIGLIVAIAVATFFYFAIEMPSQRWASRIKYRSEATPKLNAGTVVAG